MHRSLQVALLVSWTVVSCTVALRAEDPQRIQLTVEREDASPAGKAWHQVNSALIFAPEDRLRFRLSTNFPGYLYVMNHGTSGAYELLFPRSDTGSDNHIDAAKEYIVPASQGWFRASGPPGQDVIYWMVSPVELTRTYKPLPPPPAPTDPPPSMRPRCDDTIFKARGECIDNTAGVRPVKPDEELPGNLAGVAGATPRGLLFMQDKGGVVLSSPSPLSGPVVYELRLAHK